MIKNDLKEKFGEDWRSNFAHRDCDQSNYEFGEFEIDGKKINLVLNPDTLDIMDYYYDDLADDEWIEVDKRTLEKLSKTLAKKSSKFYINRKYETKAFGRKPKKISNKLYKRVSYPFTSIMSTTVYTHRLIAYIFIPNPCPNNYNVVNHIDKNKTNFKKENLEWCNATWNNKKENREIKNWSEYKYQAVDPITNEIKEEWFTCTKSSFPKLSDSGYKYWNTNKIYKGFIFRKINISLDDYLSRHPINQNGWFENKVYLFEGHKLRANVCGVLEIDGELRVGSLDKASLIYRITIGNKHYQTHKLIYEIIANTILTEDLVIDHINPVTIKDINNEFSNLRAVTRKENRNNNQTAKKFFVNIFVFNILGELKREFSSIKEASDSCNISNSVIVNVAKGNILISNDLFFLYEKDQVIERLNYIYYKFDKNKNLIFASKSLKNLSESIDKYNLSSYLNTGMPALDGYYYQQGTPKEMIYDPGNTKLEKKRQEVYWEKK